MTYTAIDLFCGAGGLSIGLQAAGIKSVFAVEVSRDAVDTYRCAFPDVTVHSGDIKEVDFRKWRGLDLVVGGPPCQPFSTGGLRHGDADHRDLLPEFVRAVLEIRPRAFILENVPGLISFSDYLKRTLRPLLDIYAVSVPRVVNAADFGVPQSRRRLIVTGVQGYTSFDIPTHSGKPKVAAGEVLGALPIGEANPSKINFAKRPDLRPNPYHGQLFNGGGRPINLERPAPTILASAGGNKTHFLDLEGRVPAYHRHLTGGGVPYTGSLAGGRRLTVIESALLQSFPTDMAFCGARSSRYTQIGNAVPLKLAQAIGESIAEQLSRQSSRKRMAA